LQEIASRHEATVPQVVLAWLLAKSPVMLPIPGTSSLAHLEENAAAVGLRLTDEEVKALTSSRPHHAI
jgi:aryl-alcohol dehydrogenase-like predicted oxidoreductase